MVSLYLSVCCQVFYLAAKPCSDLRRELAVEQAADMPVYRATFGTARPGGPLSNALDIQLKNPANTNVLLWGDFPNTRLLALWEVHCTPNGLCWPALAPIPLVEEPTYPPGFWHEHAVQMLRRTQGRSSLQTAHTRVCHAHKTPLKSGSACGVLRPRTLGCAGTERRSQRRFNKQDSFLAVNAHRCLKKVFYCFLMFFFSDC